MVEIFYDYERAIRAPDAALYHETLNIWEPESKDVFYTYTLFDKQGRALGHQECRGHGNEPLDIVENTMPDWHTRPLNPAVIINRYRDNGRQRLPARRNAVTFAAYMEDGRLLLQAVLPAPEDPVSSAGKLSLPRDDMKTDDSEAEFLRLARQELGIEIGDHFVKVGDVYEADAGRSHHVFRIIAGYDELLLWQNASPTNALGRVFASADDIVVFSRNGQLAYIAEKILITFPNLFPRWPVA